ncbi:hypothetical protein [Algoriphagus marincola]|nr:hypothetical protein [Algoriphagus marincola]
MPSFKKSRVAVGHYSLYVYYPEASLSLLPTSSRVSIEIWTKTQFRIIT